VSEQTFDTNIQRRPSLGYPLLPHTTTTVVHDWTKRRHSEVDDVNGLVVAELTRHSSAPVNAAIVEQT
jgi:hypothetical protein